MKGYFMIKYEQFLMRMFDKIVLLLSKTQSDWYPEHVLCSDLEMHVCDLEEKVCDLEEKVCNLEDENSKLREENEIMEEYITDYM